MVNMNVPYRGPDGLSAQLWSEVQARFGSRAQLKGFVTGYMDAARAGQTGGHFADKYGITHAVDLGVDIEADGTGLLPNDALVLAETLRKLGKQGKHPFSRRGYLIHDMSTTTTPLPKIAGFHTNWEWTPYTGASPHSDHIHVTTGGDQQWGGEPQLDPTIYNSREPWGIQGGDTGMAMRPVPEMYPVTQNFHADATIYNYGAGHGAIDYGTPVGTPIVAPEDGTVVHADWAWNLPGGANDWASRDYQIKPAQGDTRTGGGIMVGLRNSAGSRWWIAHLERTDMNPGDVVRKGQVIGYTGNTGSSTGPHVHVSLIPPNPDWGNGYFGAIDPAPYITEAYTPTTYVAWQGAATEGVGATTVEKEWYEMPSLDPQIAAEIGAIVDSKVQARLDAHWRYSRPRKGGAAGNTSFENEMLHLTSRQDRTDKKLDALVAGVTALIDAGTATPVDYEQLGRGLVAALTEQKGA